jgi:DNA-binding NarL/FixJ family response regulator
MIRVAIIDDHAIVRAGLRQFFSEQVDLTVVVEAANGREAVDIVRKGGVDVIVMDCRCPTRAVWMRWRRSRRARLTCRC